GHAPAKDSRHRALCVQRGLCPQRGRPGLPGTQSDHCRIPDREGGPRPGAGVMRKLGQGRSRPGSPAAALPWTTPADLRVDLERRWERGDIPRAVVQERVQAVAAVPGAAEAEPLFPLKIRLKRPSARELAERFGDVMAWVDGLRAESRERLGFGYELRWRTVNSRLHGANDIPVAAVFPQADDVLRFIRRRTEATRLGELADFIVGQFPGLAPWVIRRP